MYHKWQSYDGFLRYGAWRTEFFVILDHFLDFYHPNNPKNQNFERLKNWRIMDSIVIFHFGLFFCPFTSLTDQIIKIKKKTPGDIVILHKCTKSHDHMLYCSLDMMHNGLNCYFSFCAIFYPFTFLHFKKWKKPLEISSFYICVPKIMIRWCTVPEIWCATDGQTDGRTDGKSDI